MNMIHEYDYFMNSVLQLTKRSVHGTEDDGQEDKPSVPIVCIADCSDSQKHENDSFWAAAEHLHSVFDSRVRLMWNVCFHVIFHGDAAEGDPEQIKLI